ncbi:acyltransferase family protein [Pseudooceanicola sp. MF1-13]|uniref:acyltransferase family protein n=1 Tax=Pseudooceanicola sp. MF1-13 TaxID=3379095 RepID=UPI0038926FE3
MSIPYRAEIDGLRAIAVLAVVLDHAGVPWLAGGFVGVDVFFVISGFLITSILLQDPPGLRQFYLRRARRILPALIVVLLGCLITGWVILPPDSYKALAQSTLATLGFGSNLWFWLQTGDYFAPAAESAPLLHTWSLAVEEQFYILFPLILWGLLRVGRRAAALGILALSIASFALSVWATGQAPTANFYLPVTRAWELGIGAMLAVLPATSHSPTPKVAAPFGLILIAASVIGYDAQTPFPGAAALLPCLGAALVIWAGSDGWAARLLSRPSLRFVGIISYSLYLWHWPVLVFARTLRGGALTPQATAVCVLLSFALATLSWAMIERPFRRGSPKWPLAIPATVVALALTVTVTQGLPSRIAPEVLTRYTKATQPTPTQAHCLKAPCQIGAPSAKPSFLLWGDSHANALIPGVEAWANRTGQSAIVATRVACAPLPGMIRLDDAAAQGCADHNDRTLKLAVEDPQVVLLHARWALNTTGTRARFEAGEDVRLALRGDGQMRTNADVLSASLTQLADQLLSHGKTLILLGNVPEIGWSVPQAIFVRDRLGLPLPAAPDLPETKRRTQGFRTAVAPLITSGHLRLVTMSDKLCTPRCRTEDDGQSLYRDDDHLSAHAARHLIPPLLDTLFNSAPERTARW